MTDNDERCFFTAKAAQFAREAAKVRSEFGAVAIGSAITGLLGLCLGTVCAVSAEPLPLTALLFVIAPAGAWNAWNCRRNGQLFSQVWLRKRDDALDYAKDLRS